jgi:hypothetical protein
MLGIGRSNGAPHPLTQTLFRRSVDDSLKDDVTVIPLLVVLFPSSLCLSKMSKWPFAFTPPPPPPLPLPPYQKLQIDERFQGNVDLFTNPPPNVTVIHRHEQFTFVNVSPTSQMCHTQKSIKRGSFMEEL